MIRHPYTKVLIEREAFNRGETIIEGVMKRLNMKENQAQDAILGLTYSKPPKPRAKGTNVQGESCGRSKLKERDAKMVIFFKGMFTAEYMKEVLSGKVGIKAIYNIWNEKSWKNLKRNK